MTESCACLECRLRAVLVPVKGEMIPMNEALGAIGEITGELLAHVATDKAKFYAREILNSRKRWLRHPRVAVQQKPAGSA